MTGNNIPLVYMENITRRFGSIAALRNVYFTVKRGEIVGLLGDNGAGKSTLIKVLTGVHRPTEGQIYFEGSPVHIPSPQVARALGIETVYQDLALVNLMSISRNFFLGHEPTIDIGPLKFLDKAKMNDMTVHALGDIGIEIRRPEEEVLRMSGGERQSIAIGRAKYFGSKLLILDEPTSALSVGETGKVLGYTREAKNAGMGVIFITHNITHVYQVADRFTIISHGQKVGDFMKEEVDEQEISRMIMGAPVPEHLVSVVAEREAAIQALHYDLVPTTIPQPEAVVQDDLHGGEIMSSPPAQPVVVAAPPPRPQRTQQQAQMLRMLSTWGGLIALVIMLCGVTVATGGLAAIAPTPTATTVPTPNIAEIPPEILELQEQLLNDPDGQQRALAAAKLGSERFRDISSVEPLIQALQDEAWEVRQKAAKALGRIGDRRAVDPLQELLRDNNSVVRDEAGAALQQAFGLSCSASDGCVEE